MGTATELFLRYLSTQVNLINIIVTIIIIIIIKGLKFYYEVVAMFR
jgi:hypothetical protein